MDKVVIDYALLIGRIKDKFKSNHRFAKAMGMDKSSLSAKLNNHRDFSGSEMLKACELLEIPIADMQRFFFQQKVA